MPTTRMYMLRALMGFLVCTLLGSCRVHVAAPRRAPPSPAKTLPFPEIIKRCRFQIWVPRQLPHGYRFNSSQIVWYPGLGCAYDSYDTPQGPVLSAPHDASGRHGPAHVMTAGQVVCMEYAGPKPDQRMWLAESEPDPGGPWGRADCAVREGWIGGAQAVHHGFSRLDVPGLEATMFRQRWADRSDAVEHSLAPAARPVPVAGGAALKISGEQGPGGPALRRLKPAMNRGPEGRPCGPPIVLRTERPDRTRRQRQPRAG
jgi:hypothetical protein